MTDTFNIEPLTPHIGAEINGIDLAEPLSNETFSALYSAWLEWKVLVFRDQSLSREQHKAFARRFGSLHVHPMQHSYGGDPEVLTIKTTAESKYTAGNGWHTDVTCDPVPPLGSMLYLKETPVSGGGDTLFADLALAYDLLSDTMKALLEPLTAVHDGAKPYLGAYNVAPPAGQQYPRTEHPVIARHPETGRRILYVNSGFTTHIKGLSSWESRMLLDGLFEFIATEVRLPCRVRWEPNTLTFWDNRSTQHHAIWDYFPETRYGERVSIVGDRALPAAASA